MEKKFTEKQLIKSWYIFILVALSLFNYFNKDKWLASTFETLTPYSILFILWLILLVFPFFKELELFGIKVKVREEVEKATSEVKLELKDIQKQINNVHLNNNVTNTVNFSNDLPTDINMKELENNLNADVNKGDIKVHIPEVSEDVVDMFKIRYNIEGMLQKLYFKMGYTDIMAVPKILDILSVNEVIDKPTRDSIKEVWGILNKSIHNVSVSARHIEFVKNTYMIVMSKLESSIESLTFINCPRCKRTGYSKYENSCSHCGFVGDFD